MRGGKREGAGRPVAAPTAVMRIRLPLPVHQQVLERGGDIWLKRIINEALGQPIREDKSEPRSDA